MMVYGMVAVNAMLTHGWDGRPWVANFGVMLLILIALVGTSIGLGMVIVREFGEKNENIT